MSQRTCIMKMFYRRFYFTVTLYRLFIKHSPKLIYFQLTSNCISVSYMYMTRSVFAYSKCTLLAFLFKRYRDIHSVLKLEEERSFAGKRSSSCFIILRISTFFFFYTGVLGDSGYI